jgi:hypothetical protein
MIILVDYASPSEFETQGDTTTVGLATNARRPVRFHGTVREHGFMLRIALRALGETIWSSDIWASQEDYRAAMLDPVITVHPDRIFFEAFSQDQSVYAALIVDPAVFEAHGEVATGTTNIDFTAWLWGALGEMRTSRSTTFKIGPEGLNIRTSGAGGRFERKVDLPDSWVRGFLQTQAAMAMPGTRLSVRPIDLLTAIRFLRFYKAKVSPRALRYEFPPGKDARLVLEPWEQAVALEGAEHNYTEFKTTRVWGRRRLKLIEGLLPFAESVDIYLKGRALPSFYAVKLPGMTFVLGLTGWSEGGFTSTGGFDLMQEAASAGAAHLAPVLEMLRERYHASLTEIAEAKGISRIDAERALVRLCRQGRCMYDVETRRYRHRELFETAADEALYFPPDRRRELAEEILSSGRVQVANCAVEETNKVRKFRMPTTGELMEQVAREITYRDWRVTGTADDASTEIVINDSGRIIFGRCSCAFFDENLMNKGPCEHMLALFKASESMRTDSPTSREIIGEMPKSATKMPSRWEIERGEDANFSLDG